MRKIIVLMGASVFLLFSVTGCQKDFSSGSYADATVGDTQTVLTGIIVGSENVKFKGDSGAATAIGAGAGGLGASYLGSSTRGSLLGGLGGAVIGGLLGREVGKALTNQTGVRYLVRLDDDFTGTETSSVSHGTRSSVTTRQQKSRVISVTQGIDSNGILSAGTPVLVLMGSAGRTRVIPDRSRVYQQNLQTAPAR